jgi:hypothetical protein
MFAIISANIGTSKNQREIRISHNGVAEDTGLQG